MSLIFVSSLATQLAKDDSPRCSKVLSLLTSLKQAEKDLEWLISKTPTSQVRNELCNANINAQLALESLERIK